MIRNAPPPILSSLAIGLAIGAMPYWWNESSFLWPPPAFVGHAQWIIEKCTMPGVPFGALTGLRTPEAVAGFNVFFWTLVAYAFLGKTNVRW